MKQVKIVHVASNIWTEMCVIEAFLVTVICHWLQKIVLKKINLGQVWSLPLLSQVVLVPFYSGQRYLILLCIQVKEKLFAAQISAGQGKHKPVYS